MANFTLTSGDDLFPNGDDNSGHDSILGLAGDDTITGGTGDDTIDGGDDDDRLIGGNNNDRLLGGAGADTLQGGNNNDVLIGGAGADRLDGGANTDIASYAGSNAVTVNLATGVHAGDAAGDIYIGIERFQLSDKNDQFIASAAAAVVFGQKGADALTGGGAADELHGGDDNDSISGGGDGDSLFGDAGNDTVVGGGGNDSLDGGSFNDTLEGGLGADTLTGAGGTDTASYRNAASAVTINVRTGAHTGEAAGDIHDNIEIFDLTDNGDRFFGKIAAGVNGFGGNDTIWAGGIADTIDGGAGEDAIRGGNGDDLIQGGTEKDKLVGNANNDTLLGGAGNDEMDGGAGADSIDGGDGLDRVTFKKAVSGVSIDLGTGIHGGEATGDTYLNIEVFGLTESADVFIGNDTALLVAGNGGADHITGSGEDDELLGGEGADSLFGGIGADDLVGGASTDSLFGGEGNDDIAGDEGNDTIVGGGGGDDITAGSGSDEIIGDAGADGIDAGGGNDTVNGGDGADVVIGGLGNDLVTGDADADDIDGGDGRDNVNGGTGNDTLEAGAGRDTLNGGDDNDRLIAGVQEINRVSLNDLGQQGDDHSSHVALSSDGNVISFTSWASNLSALDTDGGLPEVHMRNLETGETQWIGTGTWSAISNGGAYVALMTYPTPTNIVQVYQTSTNTVVNTIVGAGAPYISADGNFVATSDTTTASGFPVGRVLDRGLAATDVVSAGGSGHWVGGLSSDGRYVVFGGAFSNGDHHVYWKDTVTDEVRRVDEIDPDHPGDGFAFQADVSTNGQFVAFETDATNMGPGDDNGVSDVFWKDMQPGAEVIRRVSISSDGVEANAWSGDVAISDDGRFVIFTSYANNLVHDDTNNAADIFVHDTFSGGTYRVSTGANGAEANRESVRASINGLGNVIAFESAASNLVAGDSNGRGDIFVMSGDRLIGGLGNDEFEVHSVLDAVFENPGQGTDTIRTDLSTYVLVPNVERLVYTGAQDFYGRGNTLNNELIGGAGDDTLRGAEGVDTLNGGAGGDTYTYSIATDFMTGAQLRDTIVGFTAGTDNIRIDYGTISDNFVLAQGATDGLLGQVRYNVATGRLTVQGAGAGDDPDIQIISIGAINIGDIDVTLKVDDASSVTTVQGRDNIIALGDFDNVISTSLGTDYIHGGGGNDSIDAGAGQDTLVGGFGSDTLTGGAGNDLFQYFLPNADGVPNDQFGAGVVDTITDFNSGFDRIRIDFGHQGAPFFKMMDGTRPGSTRLDLGKMHYDAGAQRLSVLGYGELADFDLEINSANAINIATDIDVYFQTSRPDYNVQIVTLGGNDYVSMGDFSIPQTIKNPLDDQTISTGAGNDTVLGSGRAETITGGVDADTISGGGGGDVFAYSITGDSQGAGQKQDLITDFVAGEDRLQIDFGTQSAGFQISDGTTDGAIGQVHYDAATQTFTAQGDPLGAGADLVIRSVGAIGLDDIDVVVTIAAVPEFSGFGGNDRITAIDTAAFTNRLRGDGGNDVLDGGLGADRLFGGMGKDKLLGGRDNDGLNGGIGDDTVDGGLGNDRMAGGDGNDLLKGGAGGDFLVDDNGADRLEGGDGNDTVVSNGLQANEKVHLGLGDDTIRMVGGQGDYFRLTHQNFGDGVATGSFEDQPEVDGGALTILLSDAQGGLDGTADVDISLANLNGIAGVWRGATVIGNAGANKIVGTGYADVIRGGDGADFLIGGNGGDVLDGGRGGDTFGFVGFHASLAKNDATGFKGVTIADGVFDGRDKLLIEAGASGGVDMADAVTMSGSGVSWSNFATKLEAFLGSDFLDEDSPLQGSQGVVLTIAGGQTAGTYLVLDKLGVGMAGYQTMFDSVIRLQAGGAQVDEADFGYLRAASATQTFVGLAGNRDVLNYALRSDGSNLLTYADRATGMNFAGQDKVQFKSSEFGGLTRLTSATFIVTAETGANLTRSSDLDETAINTPDQLAVGSKLSAAIGKLVEASAGGSVDGPYFALVYDTDKAHHGANAATYLVFDANGTDETGTVGDQNSGADPDITVIARFDGLPGAQGLDVGDFWFDVDVGGGGAGLDGVSALDEADLAPTVSGSGSPPPAPDADPAPPAADQPELEAALVEQAAAYEHQALRQWFASEFQI